MVLGLWGCVQAPEHGELKDPGRGEKTEGEEGPGSSGGGLLVLQEEGKNKNKKMCGRRERGKV